MNQKGFIKDIVIIVLAILLLGGGYFYFSKKPAYAPADNSNINQKFVDKTVGWSTFKNEKYGIEFKYPKSSDVVDESFFQNEADFQVDVSYDLSMGGYEPARLTISNVADNRYQIVSMETNIFIKNNNKDGENPIYFNKENRVIYANCVDYDKIGILDFCNKVLSTLKLIK